MNPNEFNGWKITYTFQPVNLTKPQTKYREDDIQNRLIEATLEGMNGCYPEAKNILDRIATS